MQSILLIVFILLCLCNSHIAATVTAAEQHDYTVTTIREATTDVLGIRQYACKICGESYQEYFTLSTHKWGAWHVEKVPTCLETGLEYRICTEDTEIPHREEKIIPATGRHSYIVKKIAPTCETEGEEIYTCSMCGDSFKIVTSELGHLWSEWQVEKAPTCIKEGMRYRICNRESNIVHREEEGIPATGNHSYTVSTVIEATCKKNGQRVYVCKVCGNHYAEIIPATGHTWSEWKIKKAPTCIENGIKYSVCTKSGCTSYREEIVLATGKHLYNIKVIDPTCEKAGKRIYTCSLCGNRYEETIPKLNHTYGAWIIDKKATYIGAGQRHKTCIYDATHVVKEVIPRLSKMNCKDIIFGIIIGLELACFIMLYYPLHLQLKWINRKKRELIKKYIH